MSGRVSETFGGASFRLVGDVDAELHAREFLASEHWPFHGAGNSDEIELISETFPPALESYWIVDSEGGDVGLVRLLDLDDVERGNPEFDVRIAAHRRGQGFGGLAVRWLTTQLFTRYGQLIRIEGSTRVDNEAMRATFRRCGYVKEAHHRLAWPTRTGDRVDAITYAITRSDWEQGLRTPVDWHDEPI